MHVSPKSQLEVTMRSEKELKLIINRNPTNRINSILKTTPEVILTGSFWVRSHCESAGLSV